MHINHFYLLTNIMILNKNYYELKTIHKNIQTVFLFSACHPVFRLIKCTVCAPYKKYFLCLTKPIRLINYCLL
jgi:hypothetical protein